MILTWVSPRIVDCISYCQIVTPGWLSWGQAGLTSALLALWPELRPGAGGQAWHSSRDIVTLHITLCWPAEILYTLRPVSGSRVIVSVFLKADTAPSQVPSSSSRQWLWARVISVNCLMITFSVGVGKYKYFVISLQLPNLYRICRVGNLFLN